MTKRIFLWTAPRCISTAFERSILEIPGSKVFHEPFSRSFYFGPERQSWRYLDQDADETASYQNVCKVLGKEYDGYDFVFSKDMAYAMDRNFEVLKNDNLREFQHTFLIRSPAMAVPSLYEASTNKKLTGWEKFDPDEAGFRQIYELYKFVQENFEPDPVVIDADDLIASPEGTMQAYCRETGIAYANEMLRWEPGPNPIWDLWSGWHEDVLKSSGFEGRQSFVKSPLNKKLPSEVEKCISESLCFYNMLYQCRRKIMECCISF